MAVQALTHDAEGFLSKERLSRYESLRNKPSENALSGMSPYFHFGQMAPQRAALEAAKHRKTSKVPPHFLPCILSPFGQTTSNFLQA